MMTKYSPEDLSLVSEPQTLVFSRADPADNIVRPQTFSIRLHTEEGDVEIGQLKLSTLDIGKLREECESIQNVCDSASEELVQWASAVYDHREQFKAVVWNAIELDHAFTGTVYLETLFIEPAYRGSNLGLAALYAFVRYGCLGCDSVFLKAYPFVKQDAPRPSASEHKKGRARLRKHYASIGFARIGKTDYMGLNLQRDIPQFPG